MGETNISWSDAVWNPIVGCSRVSNGCERCYAESLARRLEKMGQARYRGLTVIGKQGARWTGEVRTVPEVLGAPLHWRKGRRIFVNSMSDLFHNKVPFEYVAAVFGVMAACPQHTFQVLTKRPERALEWFGWVDRQSLRAEVRRWSLVEDAAREAIAEVDSAQARAFPATATGAPWPLTNVHLGVSAEDQPAADVRLPLLRRIPAAVRFVSYEPALGPLDLFGVTEDGDYGPGWNLTHVENRTDYGTGVEHDVDAQIGIDWVICGGESGADARPCEPAWIDAVVEQCVRQEVPVFVKQDSGLRPGGQGRLSAATWARKEFPRVEVARG